jgi:hypothetical protein
MMTAAPHVPKRRFAMFFRRVRELGGSRASWARVDPGPTRARTWGAVAVYAVWAACIAGMIGWGAVLVRGVARWENLRSRGENAAASVVQTWYTGNENDGYRYYAETYVDACACTLVVRVNNPDAHQSGSFIPVRFDPKDHSNVVPRVDRPADWLGVGIAVFIATSITAAALATMWLRTRRRCKAVVHSAEQATAVKFRAWRRTFGNGTVNYLVLYDAATPAWDEPLCCLPVLSMSLRKLAAFDVLMLYGNGMHGAAALRRENKIILPSGPVKAGRWEQSLRFS